MGAGGGDRSFVYAKFGTSGPGVCNITPSQEENVGPVPLQVGDDFPCEEGSRDAVDGADKTSDTASEVAAKEDKGVSPHKEAEALIEKLWTVDLPIVKLHMSLYNQNKILFFQGWDEKIWPQIVERYLMSTVRPWNFGDFKNHLLYSASPTFSAEANVKHYLSLERSIEALSCIIHHQYGLMGKHFLLNVANWFDYRGDLDGGDKMNTIWLHGPSDCGKTTFCEIICAIALVVARPESAQKGSTFPWNDCVNARLVFLDEAQWTKEHNNNVKKFMAGEPFHTNVKYKRGTLFRRVPILMCSNDDPFLWGFQFFTTRVRRYNWTILPAFIKALLRDGSIYPLALFHLMDRLNEDDAYMYKTFNALRNMYSHIE